MRSFRPQLLILSIMMYSICCAQFQIVHDVPDNAGLIVQPLILEDGNIITHNWFNSEHKLKKYDTQGNILWHLSFIGSNLTGWDGNELTILVEGTSAIGFSTVRYTDQITTYNDSLLDQADVDQMFQVINFNDTIISAYEIKKSYTTTLSNSSPLPEGIDAVRTPDNGLLVMVTHDLTPSESIELLKLSPNGTIEWCRSLGNGDWAFPGSYQPTGAFDISAKGKVSVASDGSIYYIEGSRFLNGHLRLAKLDPDGELLWMNRYVYGGNTNSVQFHDLAVDGTGAVHTAGFIQTTVGNFHFLMRIASDGTLERADLYRTPLILPPFLQFAQLDIDSEGRRFHRVNTHVQFTEDPSHGILIADTLGSPAQFFRRDDQIVMPNNVFIPFGGMDVHNDRIALSGLLNHEHVDLAFTTRYEALLSFDTENVFSCFMNDTMLAHIPVPLEIMTTENITNAVSLDVSAYYSVQPDTITLTSLDPEPLDTLCSFGYNLLGVEIGIAEGSLGTGIPLVKQTLVVRDRPIVLNDIGASVIEVWNTNGALIMDRNLHGELSSIPTTGWNPGMYMIRALNELGIPIRIERIMLE